MPLRLFPLPIASKFGCPGAVSDIEIVSVASASVVRADL